MNDNKRNPPCNMRSQAAANKRIDTLIICQQEILSEDLRRHDKISDSSSRISRSTCKCIRSANAILVKKRCAPYLTGDKSGAESSDKKSDREKTSSIRSCPSESGRDGTKNEAAGHTFPGSKSVAERADYGANK